MLVVSHVGEFQPISVGVPSLKLAKHLKNDGWNTSFLLGPGRAVSLGSANGSEMRQFLF